MLLSLLSVDPLGHGSLSISHQGQLPAVTLSFNLPPGVALGQVTKAIEQARLKLGAPATLSGSFQGTAQAFQQSLADEPILILTALTVVIPGVLAESHSSAHDSLDLAVRGPWSVARVDGVGQAQTSSITALILLIGIVKKNGIMIVDVALALEREQRLDPEQAAVKASQRRLRPILMTTCCAFFGGMPLIFTLGAGSEFRRPLGIAIVGGLLVSQALTLFTTPVIYVYLDRLRRRDRRGSETVAAPAAALAPQA